MIEIYNGKWSINYVKNNNSKIFVFGDNDLHIGKGGQAIIRNIHNTMGIRTKKAPNNNHSSFYSDKEYLINIEKIKKDIENIKKMEDRGNIIVLSNGGYGTGLARLNTKAPMTFKFLCDELMFNFNFTNRINE